MRIIFYGVISLCALVALVLYWLVYLLTRQPCRFPIKVLWFDDNHKHCAEAARHPEYHFVLVSAKEEPPVAVYLAYDRNGKMILPPKSLNK